MKVVLLLLIGKFQQENNVHEDLQKYYMLKKKNSSPWLEDRGVGGSDNGILILARGLC